MLLCAGSLVNSFPQGAVILEADEPDFVVVEAGDDQEPRQVILRLLKLMKSGGQNLLCGFFVRED